MEAANLEIVKKMAEVFVADEECTKLVGSCLGAKCTTHVLGVQYVGKDTSAPPAPTLRDEMRAALRYLRFTQANIAIVVTTGNTGAPQPSIIMKAKVFGRQEAISLGIVSHAQASNIKQFGLVLCSRISNAGNQANLFICA
jgi:hypothetical protein